MGLAVSLLVSPQGQAMMGGTLDLLLAALQDLTPLLRRQIIEAFGSQVGILSLSDVADSVLMWSHYAAQHRGLVLCFDERHRFFNRKRSPGDEFYHLRQAVYRSPQTHRSLTELTGLDFFLVKGEEWSYEREWRMLAPVEDADAKLEGADGPVYLFDIPPDCVVGIILGGRSSDALGDSVRALVSGDPQYRHVDVRKAAFDDLRMEVRIDEGD